MTTKKDGSGSDSTEYQRMLGERVRRMRLERQMTQLDLARLVGVTNGQISTIERGLSAPSIGTLRRISEALAVPIVCFFEPAPRQDFRVVRRSDRSRLVRPGSSETVEILAGSPTFSAIQVGLAPDQVCDRPGSLNSRDLFLYVVQGQIELSCEDQRFVMKCGDSAQADGRRSRVVRNVGDSTALILEVCSAAIQV